MTFQESIQTCFGKYFGFEGEATRSEYWWFVLFIIVAGFALAIVSRLLSGIRTSSATPPSPPRVT